MFNSLKGIFGGGNDDVAVRQRYFDLASEFEKTVSTDFPSSRSMSKTVDTAKKIRDMISSADVALAREDKLKLLKMLNKAKVRALMANEEYSFELFSSLDSISADVARKI